MLRLMKITGEAFAKDQELFAIKPAVWCSIYRINLEGACYFDCVEISIIFRALFLEETGFCRGYRTCNSKLMREYSRAPIKSHR
jgi:hypothetical protein